MSKKEKEEPGHDERFVGCMASATKARHLFEQEKEQGGESLLSDLELIYVLLTAQPM